MHINVNRCAKFDVHYSVTACVYYLGQISIISIDGIKSQQSKKLQKMMKIYYKTTSLCTKDNDLFRLRFYTFTHQNNH